MWMSVGRRSPRVNVWQGSMVIMLIFLFSFKTLEEYFLSPSLFPRPGQSSATYAAHFYATAGVVKGTEIWESGQLWMVAC